jgi:SH3-like domain-containing protein
MRAKSFVILAIFASFFFFIYKSRNRLDKLSIGLASLSRDNVIAYSWSSNKAKKTYILHHRYWPIYVLKILGNWALCEDIDGEIGWINKRDISRIQHAVFLQDFIVRKGSDEIVLHKGCIARLIKINENSCVITILGNAYSVPASCVWLHH